MDSFRFVHGLATRRILLLLLLLLLLRPSMVSGAVSNFSFTFLETLPQLVKDFTFTGNSSSSQGAVQIPPFAIENQLLSNQSGSILFKKPFIVSKSIADGSTLVASFSSRFRFTFLRTRRTKGGEGLAFVIMSSGDRDPPPGSHGGYLGLVNASTDGEGTNGFAAVEFDNFKQDMDPDDNHIGLDVNGVHSISVTSLTPFGIDLNDGKKTNYMVHIEYNGTTRHISVSMGVDNGSRPNTVLQSPMDLSRIILGNTAYFGFSASTGLHQYQYSIVLGWNLTVEQLDEGSNKTRSSRWKLGLGVGLPGGVTLLALGIVFAVLVSVRRREKKKMGAGVDMRSIPGILKEFKYADIEAGTKSFHDDMKLGEGGFGVVYRALVQGQDGRTTEVAVKRFSSIDRKAYMDFLSELRIINRLRHRNLVNILGWCHQGDVFLLVYELMSNGSLDNYIVGSRGGGLFLTWDQRLKIVVGVASGINYLHHEYGKKVIHRDIKCSNIMLNAALNPKIGDFGLARALDNSMADAISCGGTVPYIAPECYTTRRATSKSDVYGFGAVILEVLCGRPFGNIIKELWTLYGEGNGRILEAMDSRLAGDFDDTDAERLLLLGLACIQSSPGARPGMQEILRILTSSDPPPHITNSDHYLEALAQMTSTDGFLTSISPRT